MSCSLTEIYLIMKFPLFELASLDSISLYDGVSDDVLSATSSVTYRLSRNNRLSKEGLLFFLKYHPVHVVKTRSTYKCFAGLRGYQLAVQLLPSNAKINVVVHNKKSISIEDETSLDPLISLLIYGLDDIAYETDFLNVWKAATPKSRKRLLPGLNNKKNLEILLRCSRKKLSRKSKELISRLKKENSVT